MTKATTGPAAKEVGGPGDGTGQGRPSRLLATVGWWLVTLIVLVVLDDLAFGPFFWVIARTASPLVAFFVALAIYVPAQVAIVHRGTSGHPGRIGSFFLNRLDLDRRHTSIRVREDLMRDHVRGALSSCILSLVIGGVIPPMLLWRRGHSTSFVRRLSLVTATIYATEFALLHGFLPGVI